MDPQLHELHNELPEFRAAIDDLSARDAHFAALSERYNEVNEHVARIESELEPATDFELEDLKKERLRLKDELYAMLNRFGMVRAEQQ